MDINLINNNNSGTKILSVSKSSFKAKTEKQKNIDNQKKDNKTSSNYLNSEKSSKENLNKNPLLVKPINNQENSNISSNKKNLDKLANPISPVIE